MAQWFRSEAWRLRWLPFLTAAAGLTAAFLLQDVPIVRRHALLLALLAGLGFFLPAVRHRLLILWGCISSSSRSPLGWSCRWAG
jgi:hypothetical protein